MDFYLLYLAIARNPVESYYGRRAPASPPLLLILSCCDNGIGIILRKVPCFNLAVIVFTRRSINDLFAICRVDTRSSILYPGRHYRYRSYNSILTREKWWLLIGGCTDICIRLSRSSRFKSHSINFSRFPIELCRLFKSRRKLSLSQGHRHCTDTLKGWIR